MRCPRPQIRSGIAQEFVLYQIAPSQCELACRVRSVILIRVAVVRHHRADDGLLRQEALEYGVPLKLA